MSGGRKIAALSEWRLDGGAAPLRVVVNPRARRLIIRVDAARREVVVTAPSAREIPQAMRFAESRRDWITQMLRETPAPIPFAAGARIPILGRDHEIHHDRGQRQPVRQDAERGRLTIGGDPRHLSRRLADWLKRRAAAELGPRVARYAAALDARPGRIRLRDPKSRWGSCARSGALSFSWRLVFAPPHVVDYVAAHECAHLRHLDHSPAFWKCLRAIYGDPARAAAWMAANGARLHAYGAPDPAGGVAPCHPCEDC